MVFFFVALLCDLGVAEYEAYRQPDKIVAGLALKRGMRVADVGAGRGFLEARLADAVGARGHVVATDVDEQALLAIADARVEKRAVAAGEPGLEVGRYDRILLAEVDHYLPNRVAYLGKLKKALAPSGFIAVTNRLVYRDALTAAARAAGFSVTEIGVALPAHFYLRLESLKP